MSRKLENYLHVFEDGSCVVEIHTMTKGIKYVLFDYCDYKKIQNYSMRICTIRNSRTQYASITVNDKEKLVHVVLFKNKLNDSNVIDHKDGDGLNNMRQNIRSCARNQNIMNQKKQNKITSSIYKGVYFNKVTKCFEAYITAYKKRTYLGAYRIEKAAGAAYNEAAKRVHGEFANLNAVDCDLYEKHKVNGRSLKPRKVMQLSLDELIEIKTWNSIKQTETFGFKRKQVYRCCIGDRDDYMGYKWKFA